MIESLSQKFLSAVELLQSFMDQIIPIVLFIGVIITYFQYRRQKRTLPDPELITWIELGKLFLLIFILQLGVLFMLPLAFEDGVFYIINFVLIPIFSKLFTDRLSSTESEKIKTLFPGLTVILALILSVVSAIIIYSIFG